MLKKSYCRTIVLSCADSKMNFNGVFAIARASNNPAMYSAVFEPSALVGSPA